MKKIIILLAILLSATCCTEKNNHTYTYTNLSEVALEGGIVLDKYTRTCSHGYKVPQVKLTHILGSNIDTLIWDNVPLEIYISYEIGDTIWPLRKK